MEQTNASCKTMKEFPGNDSRTLVRAHHRHLRPGQKCPYRLRRAGFAGLIAQQQDGPAGIIDQSRGRGDARGICRSERFRCGWSKDFRFDFRSP